MPLRIGRNPLETERPEAPEGGSNPKFRRKGRQNDHFRCGHYLLTPLLMTKIDPLLVSRNTHLRSSVASELKGQGKMPDPNPSGKTIRHQ